MELKIKVHSKPRIEYEARNVNGHESTVKERECMIEEFKRRNADNVDLATCQYLLIQAFGSGVSSGAMLNLFNLRTSSRI